MKKIEINRLSDYLKKTYGTKVYKLPLDGGFSCPNRKNSNGCIFCSESGSGEFTFNEYSIKDQVELQIKRLSEKKKADKFIAYFQSFTNTYKPVNELRKIYSDAIDNENVLVLDIATRGDCLDDEKIKLLSDINKQVDVWVEMGLQSTKKSTIDLINRAYSNEVYFDMAKKLMDNGIKVISHVIAGLPHETEDDFLESVYQTQMHDIWGIKIHSLYIQTDSRLYDYYLQNKFKILTMDEYTDWVVDSFKILNEDTVVHRMTGDAYKPKLYLPKWSCDKLKVISEINSKIKTYNT